MPVQGVERSEKTWTRQLMSTSRSAMLRCRDLMAALHVLEALAVGLLVRNQPDLGIGAGPFLHELDQTGADESGPSGDEDGTRHGSCIDRIPGAHGKTGSLTTEESIYDELFRIGPDP